MRGKRDNHTGQNAAFQDALFSPVRVVQRTLESRTILTTLEPLPGKRVRVVRYRRKRVGECWITDKHEAGQTCAWRQLGLPRGFKRVFGS